MESGPLSIGIIGTGGMGTRHAENLARFVGGARVAGVYDADADRAARASTLCGGAAVYSDPLALIHADQIDALIIAAPDDTHVHYTLACLRAGKAVLCEKPLATNPEDGKKVIDAEMQIGKRLVSVGFMRRFDPQHVAVKQVISSGELGRAILYKGIHRNANIPYSVSGEVVITNSAGHDLDAACWLLGQEIEEVTVRGVRSHTRFSPETMDVILIQMALSGDCLAAIEVYVAAEYGYEVAAEVVAERGSATTPQPDATVIRAGGARAARVPGEWLERFQNAYVAELAAWVESLRCGEIFSGASAWDGYTALLSSAACIQALKSGQPRRVGLPPRPEFYRA